jgi:thiamine biosynthesis lipoprotein
MNLLRIAALAALLASLGACAKQPGAQPLEPALVEVRVSQFHMGMMVDLIAWAPTKRQGEEACAAAFKKIAALNAILSDYEPQSELSRFCKTAGAGPHKISPELFTVLETANKLAAETDGRYDITAAPVIKLWREARKTGKLPGQSAIAEALTRVGYQKLKLTDGNRAELTNPAMQIDLGSIAKGYIGDAAIAELKNHGIPRAAYIAGGDMVFADPPPNKKGWPVDPARPDMQLLELSNCACSVSGDTQQFLEVNGTRYSHVIDARTGAALTDHTMCIIIAPRGLLSDPLSTIATIIPESKFKKIAEKFPNTQYWIFKSQ